MNKWWERIKERFADEYMPRTQIKEPNQPNIEPIPAETTLPKTEQQESAPDLLPAQQNVPEAAILPPQKSDFDTFMEHVDEHNKLVTEYRKQYAAAIATIVKKHYRTLKTKYDQTVYTDDYGYVILEHFLPELDYFTSNVLLKEVPPFYYDACIATDSTLWDSYKKLKKEYLLNLSQNQKKEANLKSGYAWHYATAFCFELQVKDVNDISDFDISGAGIHANISFKVSIIDDPVEEKKKIIELQDTDQVLFYVYSRIKDIAFTLFTYTRIIEESVEQKVLKIPGIEKAQSAPDNPLEYEKYISECLAELGFDAHTTKASGDQGADVLAEKNGVSFAIQCKKYSSPVGNKAVQEANAGRDFYKCDYGVVVSNAGFTKSAKQAANACKIILLNDTRLEKLLEYTTDRSASE